MRIAYTVSGRKKSIDYFQEKHRSQDMRPIVVETRHKSSFRALKTMFVILIIHKIESEKNPYNLGPVQ